MELLSYEQGSIRDVVLWTPCLLASVGKQCGTTGTGLGGVAYDSRGIRQRPLASDAPHIYAAGDVAHDLNSRRGRKHRHSQRSIPRPGVSRLVIPLIRIRTPNLPRWAARQRRRRATLRTPCMPLSEIDRAVHGRCADGFAVLVHSGSDRLAGAALSRNMANHRRGLGNDA